MMDIRLFVSAHKPFPVPEHPLLSPIQGGAALGEGLQGFLRDDTGENISALNRSYCELTTQYWAWKNVRADYYGFFHYRRYLYPDLEERRPYIIRGTPTAELLDKLGYAGFPELIARYDLIAPKGEEMHLSVRAHYAGARYHHGEDLALMESILRADSPEYIPAMEEYLSGGMHYFGNLYIMSRQVLERYFTWLFPLLGEFDCRVDAAGYSAQERRVDGYLAERLFGVFYTKLRAEGARTLELPRVDFIPEAGARCKRRVINALLPPGSRRRAAVKRQWK